MTKSVDINKFKNLAILNNRYEKQLLRLQKKENIPTDCIEKAVMGAVKNLAKKKNQALVIYGEPQSGKTEMMICLTAKLLDQGHKIIIHLMNDSVDLLTQNLRRFKTSGLAPAAKTSSELLQLTVTGGKTQEIVAFCKKNARDLEKVINKVSGLGPIVVIDDEADYATPNSKVNTAGRTSINKLIGALIEGGSYIGVTATPARLDLNHTFDNDTEEWVNFPAHAKYTGQDVFFPIDRSQTPYRLKLLDQTGSVEETQDALIRFMVTVSYLNVHVHGYGKEQDYSMLVHTSGRKQDHEADRGAIEDSLNALIDPASSEFSNLVNKIIETSKILYPKIDSEQIAEYVVTNASRKNLVVLNSERDKTAAGDRPTDPSSPFTIIIGGNIVSRGVTFPNLLSMYFTRNVRHKLQQDTYIQRARMFGARGSYLEHFELTIPTQLYSDWHRCFVFHRLALETVNSIGSPVWIGDKRISITANPSVHKATVSVDKGEMSFGMFDYDENLEILILKDQTSIATLRSLRRKLGNEVLPKFLIDYLAVAIQDFPDALAIHTSASIDGYDTADQETISRTKGFMGKSDREERKFPSASHHIKIFYNAAGKAKLFYKCKSTMQFVQGIRS